MVDTPANTGTGTGDGGQSATPGAGSGDSGATSSQQQQAGGQQQGGQQQQQGQEDYLGQLLAGRDTGTGDGSGGSGDGTGTGGDGGDGTQPGSTGDGSAAGGDGGDTPLTRSDLDRAAQQIADRQVNALLKRLGMDGKNKGSGKQTGQQGQQQPSQQPQQQVSNEGGGEHSSRASAGPDPADAREARMAFREYFADTHKPVDPAEREIAHTLSGAAITSELGEHGDPDRAGRAAATSISEQLSTYRKAIERATVDELRRRGALTQTGQTAGGGSAPPGQPPAPANLADKRSAAQAAAERINQQNGHASQAAG